MQQLIILLVVKEIKHRNAIIKLEYKSCYWVVHYNDVRQGLIKNPNVFDKMIAILYTWVSVETSFYQVAWVNDVQDGVGVLLLTGCENDYLKVLCSCL